MRPSAPSTSPPQVNIIIDQCPAMPIPSTLNKCTPMAVTPPPKYRAPKRHFQPASPMRPPTQSSTPPFSQVRPTPPPFRPETEPLLSLLFQSEGHSPRTQPPLRPNRLAPPSLTRTERIMLRRPSPSPRSQRNRRGVPLRYRFRLPRDLSLVASLGLIALIAVCSLTLIHIGNMTVQKTCLPSGGGSRPSNGSVQ